ncbi:MAG: ABC transporter substrate-binding protein, partial [Allorhizobium sp.]
LYVAEEKSALSVAEIQAILERPDTRYTLTPLATGKFADFMHRTGALKTRPASWRDYYFPEIHDLEGS